MDLLSLVSRDDLDAVLPVLEKRAAEARAERADITKEADGLIPDLKQSVGKWWGENPYQGAMRNAAIGAAGGAALGGVGSALLGPKDRKKPLSGALMGGLLGGAVGGGYGLLPHLSSLAQETPRDRARGPAADSVSHLENARDEEATGSANPLHLLNRIVDNVRGQRYGAAASIAMPNIQDSIDNPGVHAGVGAGILATPFAARWGLDRIMDPSRVRQAAPAGSPIKDMTWGQITGSNLRSWLPGGGDHIIGGQTISPDRLAAMNIAGQIPTTPRSTVDNLSSFLTQPNPSMPLTPAAREALTKTLEGPNAQRVLDTAMTTPNPGWFGRNILGRPTTAPGLNYGDMLTRRNLADETGKARPPWTNPLRSQVPLQIGGHLLANRLLSAESARASGAMEPMLADHQQGLLQAMNNLKADASISPDDPRVVPPALPAGHSTHYAWQTPRGRELQQAHAQYLQHLQNMAQARNGGRAPSTNWNPTSW